MNKQFEIVNGVKVNTKIEWCDFTHNALVGCLHNCRWTMPETKETVICYAEKQVETRWLKQMYPEGFKSQYWKPERLAQPLKVKTPARIFEGSVTDVFGHWQRDEHIQAILDMCKQAHWHTFQFLTKNPTRVKDFQIPKNCWIGASVPPDEMWGNCLNANQQNRMLLHTLDQLRQVKAFGASVTWLSIEPLSRDWMPVFNRWLRDHDNLPISWAVIGAASNGKVYHQPETQWVQELVELLGEHGCRIFYKGNLRPLPYAAANWREEFPVTSDLNMEKVQP